MKTYLLLLRGINVAGQKKIKMSDLKLLLEQLQFEKVTTYIQSGNVVFKSSEENKFILEDKVFKSIQKSHGFDVPVLILEKENFVKIIENASLFKTEEDRKKAFFVLLKDKPDRSLIAKVNEEKYSNEEFVITPNCIYLYCKNGYGNAKCNNNFFERKLKVEATTRNYKTMMKLAEMLIEN